jgi:hypothetical protein
MTRRLTALGLLVLTLALVGCGSDDKGDAASATGTAESDASTQVGTPDPAAFDETLARLTTELDEAEGDLCALFGKLEGAGAAGDPKTEDQVRIAFRFLGAVYEKIADAAPAELEAAASQIRKSAAEMVDEADGPIDVETARKVGPSAYEDKAFLEAMSGFAGIVTNCGAGQGG